MNLPLYSCKESEIYRGHWEGTEKYEITWNQLMRELLNTQRGLGKHQLKNSQPPPPTPPPRWPRAPALGALLHALNLHWSYILSHSFLGSEKIQVLRASEKYCWPWITWFSWFRVNHIIAVFYMLLYYLRHNINTELSLENSLHGHLSCSSGCWAACLLGLAWQSTG